MERILTKELHSHLNQSATLKGWVDVRRDHGKLMFVDLRDRSGTVQLVILPAHEEAYKAAQDIRAEWVIEIEGEVHARPEHMKNEKEDNGDVEIEVTALSVVSAAETLPFERNTEVNLDTLLDYRPLTLRNDRERRIFKVQSEIVNAYRDALRKRDFIEFQAPKIVGGDAEGGAHVFKIEYLNDKTAYLATSPQLYKQVMVGVYERVYSIGDVFRAEKHSTTRHLNEYTSLDAEMGFICDHTDIMDLLSDVLRDIISELKKSTKEVFDDFGVSLPKCPEKFPHMKLKEAQELIYKETKEDCRDEKDLAPEHERWLSEYAKKEYDSDFIFITHFPREKTAFYAYDDPEDEGYTKYFDLLFRGVELCSGGQRMHEYQKLKEKMVWKGLDPEKFEFYLQAFKYGMPPHGGWGMGLERLTQKFLNLENVKEATLFPREINRIDARLSESE
ncbi:MAG: aspartate--tRNA(Asn) ligase [Candidatus Paceibacterota bacterium]